MLTDTHAHLDFPEFQTDFKDVLARADAAGVKRILTIGTSVESSRRAVALAERLPNIHAVIGVHPTAAIETGEDAMEQLRQLAQSPRVVAIGETGLDYHRLPSGEVALDPEHLALGGGSTVELEASIKDGAYKSAQAVLFQQQLDLAVELGLNVVIHQRDAWSDTLQILGGYTGKLRAVYHCFGNTFEEAESLFALGHLISFTGIVTFKNAPLVHEAARKVPSERYMVETDCPYLAPVPFRGKRCEPAHTLQVAEEIARLRGETLAQVAETTERNAENFFRFAR
ncbi:MAG: TatD family hydrolase [Verrucomicrobiota bacterium]|nr:TatD family hydrolase [Verrucomicrobiota bacterium]